MDPTTTEPRSPAEVAAIKAEIAQSPKSAAIAARALAKKKEAAKPPPPAGRKPQEVDSESSRHPGAPP